MSTWASPLLEPGSTILDDRQRAVVETVSAAERAHILALPSDDLLDPRRRARIEATGPELFAQPEAVRATLLRNANTLDAVAERLAAGFRRVVLVGAGDSLAVMAGARLALEQMLGVPCEPVQSLEFAYYAAHALDASTAVLALSSSGETTRTVEALLVAQRHQMYTVALTNTRGSTLEREATTALQVEATRVGWPTQSSTAALALLLELAVRVGERRGATGAGELRSALDALPGLMAVTLGRTDATVAAIAEREVRSRTVLFAGGGPSAAAATMGAAKVKECTPGHAFAVQVEEYHHYTSQKPDEPLVLLAPSGPTVPRATDTGRDAHRWGGRLYVVTTEGERAFDDLDAEGVLFLPAVPEPLSPLLFVLPAQLVGYHLGLAGVRAAETDAAVARA
ncbi:SIS domain-containing protein [Luteimicrobium subarcticum]|uniref:Glutamine--fructose-6-phosphate aminotransferase [isomerizing] n=1 Tax=Luteimicrobium subarcticum TaxID=620910 RepID=A0A2M8WRG1_9MICO|nr:SIS domain-containing protein [Luteimicrobium subarcticum]PJI93527.1 SIS domain-containing protein [Luteimicrobium subarcticum]